MLGHVDVDVDVDVTTSMICTWLVFWDNWSIKLGPHLTCNTVYRFSGAPWLFILTACRVCENKWFRIVRVLMFPVAALIIKSFSLLSSIEKFIA